jgi:hypothetical protein
MTRPVWPVVTEIWNVLIKVHNFLEHLLVFCQTVLQDGRFDRQENENPFLTLSVGCGLCTQLTGDVSVRLLSCLKQIIAL